MRRLFWLAAGATAGVLVVRKVQQTASRTAAKLTPSGIGTSVSGALNNLAEAARDFAADVRDGMAQRETELWTSLQGSEPDAPAATPFDAPGGIR